MDDDPTTSRPWLEAGSPSTLPESPAVAESGDGSSVTSSPLPDNLPRHTFSLKNREVFRIATNGGVALINENGGGALGGTTDVPEGPPTSVTNTSNDSPAGSLTDTFTSATKETSASPPNSHADDAARERVEALDDEAGSCVEAHTPSQKREVPHAAVLDVMERTTSVYEATASRERNALVAPAEAAVEPPAPTTDSHIRVRVTLPDPDNRIIQLDLPRASTASTLRSLVYPELVLLPYDLSATRIEHNGVLLDEDEVVGDLEGVTADGLKLVVPGAEVIDLEVGAVKEVDADGDDGEYGIQTPKSATGVTRRQSSGVFWEPFNGPNPKRHSSLYSHPCKTCGILMTTCVSCSKPLCANCAFLSSSRDLSTISSVTVVSQTEKGTGGHALEAGLDEDAARIVQCKGCRNMKKNRDTVAVQRRRRTSLIVAITILVMVALFFVLVARGILQIEHICKVPRIFSRSNP
ncbi:hypothetical protein HK101_001292 [Irineochytrium annulatum]|nr:hypothetical protein HK101_001292 [Irineochytrium annulatum]